MKVIDLFAGCGGFSEGFSQAGFKITKAVEFDQKIAVTYQNNHRNTKLYISDISEIDVSASFLLEEAEVIIGGPPCQGFSMAGSRNRIGFIDDDRNYLFKYYFEIVKRVKPKVFIMENVKGLLTMNSGQIFNEIVKIFGDVSNFSGDKYNLYYEVVNSSKYGVPQNRERLIIVGVLNTEIDYELMMSKTIDEIKKTNANFFDQVNIWDAIGDLGPATVNGKKRKAIPKTNFQKYLSGEKLFVENHLQTNHSANSIERMKKIKPSENYLVLEEKINSIHSGSYGRMEKAALSSTITTRFDTPSGGRFIHPVYDRTITPREAARIQSFPDDFIFHGNKSSITRQIGNAVPVKLAYFYAFMTRGILNEYFNKK